MGCCSSKLNFYSGEIFALLNKCDENSECIGLAQLIKVEEKKFGFSKTKKTRPNSKHLSQCTVITTNMQSKNKTKIFWKHFELNNCHSVHLLSL
jgi:hypothetical protein